MEKLFEEQGQIMQHPITELGEEQRVVYKNRVFDVAFRKSDGTIKLSHDFGGNEEVANISELSELVIDFPYQISDYQARYSLNAPELSGAIALKRLPLRKEYWDLVLEKKMIGAVLGFRDWADFEKAKGSTNSRLNPNLRIIKSSIPGQPQPNANATVEELILNIPAELLNEPTEPSRLDEIYPATAEKFVEMYPQLVEQPTAEVQEELDLNIHDMVQEHLKQPLVSVIMPQQEVKEEEISRTPALITKADLVVAIENAFMTALALGITMGSSPEEYSQANEYDIFNEFKIKNGL